MKQYCPDLRSGLRLAAHDAQAGEAEGSQGHAGGFGHVLAGADFDGVDGQLGPGGAAAGAAAASLLVAGAAAGTGADGSFLEQAASATVNSRQAPSRERAGMFLHSIGDSPLHDPWYRRAARPLARAIPP